MTKQFKHESDNYIPLLSSEGTRERPWWVNDDELILYVNNNTDFITKKINTLSKEEFIKYQKEGRIPKSYKLEEWI